jgi:hypothetical protein
MFKAELLPKISASSQGFIKLLEDIRLLLGLSQEEMHGTLSLLEKADWGSLRFSRGNIDIRFESYRLERLNSNEISVELEVKEEDLTRSVKYNIPRAYLRLVKKKTKSSHD